MRFLIIMYSLSILAGGCTGGHKGTKRGKTKKSGISIAKTIKTQEGTVVGEKTEDVDIDRETLEEEFIKYEEFTQEVQEATKEYVTKTEEFKTSIAALDFDSSQENDRKDAVKTVWNKFQDSQKAFMKVYCSQEAAEAGNGFSTEARKVYTKIDEIANKLQEVTKTKEDEEKEVTKLEITELTIELDKLIQDAMGLLIKKTDGTEDGEEADNPQE